MRWKFFLSASKIKSLLLHVQTDLQFLGWLFKEKNKRKVSACFFEIIVIINIAPEAVTEFLFSFSSLQLVDFCLCFSAIGWFIQGMYHSHLIEKYSGSQAASCKHSQGQIVSTQYRPLKRIIGLLKNFQTQKWFHRSKQKLLFRFFY